MHPMERGFAGLEEYQRRRYGAALHQSCESGRYRAFHNDSKYILQALPQILEYYQQAGYRIIPISELLLEGDTWIDHAGTQHLATPAPSAAEKETDIESKKIEQ